MTSQRGFTLIELVAAMAIFAIMSVMAYGGLMALLNTKAGLDESYDRLEGWQLVTHRLQLDFGQVRARPVRDEFGDVQPAMFEPEEGRLEFTHGGRRNPLSLPRSSLERVAWYLDTDGTLVRQSWRNLDRGQSELPITTKIMQGVEELKWRFLDDDDEWQEDWPPSSLSQTANQDLPLPRAVEMQLESKRYGLLRFLFATKADLNA